MPDTEESLEQWLQLNAEMAQNWPNITIKREPPADAKEWDGKPGKYEAYFSSEPGQGDEARAVRRRRVDSPRP